MANVDALDENYKPVAGTNWNLRRYHHPIALQPSTHPDHGRDGTRSFDNAVHNIFHHYNLLVKKFSSATQRIIALAWLLQNLAFIHPLGDENGRSRLLLLQYELRRAGIACGTMMYNNGKNVYFDTLDTFVYKIEEGIQMYDAAMSSGQNPWEHPKPDFLKNRSARFDVPYADRLTRCWAKWNPPSDEQSTGTSPL
eukprot:gnl/TRDRNA2_/TRDRNA2_33014_c0_seq1.p1 gnl/TRDRNA2_/TRDRNA2_33014_c0~~gnl/TRDRNA2_/TRDRNA2_33014_c0_seq1.p1  ORF type:complete len:215 (-),score=26.37 gnl/TRDRNA2_/TRDRNA2_33014_c0_seq1:38-625(-)